jgi:thiol-disulfide isomerase/thioredoxin
MLLIGLQWIASQFAKVGLLPEFIAKRLGLAAAATGEKGRTKGFEGRGCCGDGGEGVVIERGGGEEVVEHVDDLARWEAIFAASEKSTPLFVKFTADWCKPCKSIQPAYASLASRHNRRKGGGCKFVTLDVDGDGCDVISGRSKVAMLPTFVCFKGGKEVGRMSGGNDGDKLGEWVDEMLCRLL